MTIGPDKSLLHYRVVGKIGEERFLVMLAVPDPIDSKATVELIQNWPLLVGD